MRTKDRGIEYYSPSGSRLFIYDDGSEIFTPNNPPAIIDRECR
jgi:hypothetical protein